jgi:hypothetical protein
MSKRLQAMRSNPHADWTISDIQSVCGEFGIACLPSRAGSSHYKVSHPQMRDILTVPFKRPIKPVYIRKLINFIETVRALP